MLKVVGASWEQTRFTFLLLGVVSVLAIVAIFFYDLPIVKNDGYYAATVYWTKGTRFRVVYLGQNNDPQKISLGVARAYYREDSSHTGWATLEIQTNPSYPDWVQSYGAGLLEGALCWRMIYWHWQNTIANYCKDREEFCRKFRKEVLENAEKTRKEATEKEDTDDYWHQVNMFYVQLDGIEEGWKSGVQRSRKAKIISIPHVDFLWMNSASDIRDLEFMNNVTKSYDPTSPANSIALLKYLNGSTPNFYLAHEAAGYYSEMLRVQKKYSFNFHETSKSDSPLVVGNTTIFTSYPGSIYSQDDFYQIPGSRLTVAGSTIKNYNRSLWNDVDMKNVMLGPRVVAANRLSKTGEDWTDYMSRKHSGTGNKQWLVVQAVSDDAKLHVLEQMPGISVAKDMTEFWHNSTYWLSYGVPFYEELRNSTGYLEGDGIHLVNRMKKVVDALSEGQKNVTDDRAMLKLMRMPEITAVGRSDIIVLNITSDSIHHVVDDHGFSVHYTPHKNNKTHLRSDNHILESSKGFKDYFHGMFDNKTVNDRTKDKSHSPNYHRMEIHGEEKEKLKEYDGLIDLKISLGHSSFKALAGPPYTETDSVFVEPFEWSKSSHQDIPHYGQRDKYDFEPTSVNWNWI